MLRPGLTSSHLLTNYCLPLVSIALLLNLIADKNFEVNNYNLTAFLIFNYVSLVFVSFVSSKTRNDINRWIPVTIASIMLAFALSRLLSLDCTLYLTLWSFISNAIYAELFSELSLSLRSSFSLAELLIVSQLSVSYLSTATACLISRLLRSSKTNLFCSSGISDHVIQVIFGGIASIVILQVVLTRNTRIRSKVIDVVALLVPIGTTYYLLSIFLETNPISWLIDFLFSDANRTHLMSIWFVILSLTVIFTAVFAATARTNASTVTRKLFHLSISLVFLTGLKEDVTFLSFCSAALLAIFVMLEVLRVRRIGPFAIYIENAYHKFRDEKDSGLLTLTHIYLLVGTSLPIWLTSRFTRHNLLAMSSGIITVGVGDTAAAVGGSLFGRHRWKSSKKTYEGTVCAFLAQLCASYFIANYLTPDIVLNMSNIIYLAVISLTTAVIEAKLNDIDNLILPICYYILVKVFFK